MTATLKCRGTSSVNMAEHHVNCAPSLCLHASERTLVVSHTTSAHWSFSARSEMYTRIRFDCRWKLDRLWLEWRTLHHWHCELTRATLACAEVSEKSTGAGESVL